MKEPSYYRSLPTTELAIECFSGVFAMEVHLFDNPRWAFQRLRIRHDGFAELLQREDMWKGVLAAYDHFSSTLTPESSLVEIMKAAMTLDALGTLYALEFFREQVRGREEVFLGACLLTLRRFRSYLESNERERAGFFRAPIGVERVDPAGFAASEDALKDVRWPKEQDIRDVASFLDLVIPALARSIAPAGGERPGG